MGVVGAHGPRGGAYALLVAALLLVCTAGARAVVIEVSQVEDVIREGDGCSLREAIRSANRDAFSVDCTNGTVGHDVIELPASLSLRYYLTAHGAPAEDDAESGDLDVTEDLTIRGTFLTAGGRPHIDALSQFTLFEVHGVRLTIEDVVLENGAGVGDESAGAVRNSGGFLTLHNVELSGHYAHADSSAAGGVGGAIWSDTAVVLDECVLRGNIAHVQGGLCGGAVFSATGFAGTNTTFEDNDGRDLTFIEGGDPFVPSCAGAVAVSASSPLRGSVTCEECRFLNNRGSTGGAVMATTSVLLEASTFVGNRATGSGGAVFSSQSIVMDGSRLNRQEGELTNNQAEFGSGGVAFSSLGDVTLSSFRNVAGNTAQLSGGVAYSYGWASLERVGGDAYGNVAVEGDGGVLASVAGSVSLRDVRGHVRNNRAGAYGGVMYAGEGTAALTHVYGGVFENEAFGGGGVALSRYDARVQYVSGDIADNVAHTGNGGVAYAEEGRAFLENIEGDVARNVASQSGGVVWASHCSVYRTGDFVENTADVTDGGALYCRDSLALERSGALLRNVAGRYGGFAYLVGVGNARLDVVRGAVTDNQAQRGGVVYQGTATTGYAVYVSEVRGEVSRNTGGAFVGQGVTVFDVRGGIAGNESANEGGVIGGTTVAWLETVYGSVSDNAAAAGAVLHCSADRCRAELSYVNGEVARNRAQVRGGVVMSHGSAAVHDVGDLVDNTSGTFGSDTYALGYEYRVGGGVVFSDLDATVQRVGVIANNRVVGFGGVVCSVGNVVLESCGAITGNEGTRAGGVVYSRGKSVLLADVAGSISYNEARYGGGVVFSPFAHVRISSVAGSVTENLALNGSGGVVSALHAYISDVAGELSENHAGGSGGCVAVEEELEVARIGDVLGNTAFRDGGCFRAYQARISYVGRVADNAALRSGGVVFGELVAYLHDVAGPVEGNVSGTEASYGAGGSGGGVAHGGYVELLRVGADVRNNAAWGLGGVLYATRSAHLEDVYGGVHGNTAALSGGVVAHSSASGTRQIPARIARVAGSVADNGCRRYGGVIYSRYGLASISDVDGSVVSNYACGAETVSARCGGGVLFGLIGRILRVGGSVSGNTAIEGYGGVVYAETNAEVINVGDVQYNASQNGGVLFGYGLLYLIDVAGNVSYNEAEQFGGVIGAPVYNQVSLISNVSGDITRNIAGRSGGIISGAYVVSIENVTGALSYNVATLRGGGAIYSRGLTSVHNIGGDIAGNSAGSGGGFAQSYVDALVYNIGGNVVNNSAQYGGVIAAFRSAYLSDVHGSIVGNYCNAEAQSQSGEYGGGVLHALNTLIRRVQGSIERNVAYQGSGGVCYGVNLSAGGAKGVVLIDQVGGSVCDNTAELDGGVSASGTPGDVTVSNVYGAVCRNTAGGYGGVLYAVSGSAEVISTGAVYGNRAGVHGGVVMGYYSATVAHVRGSVFDNSAEGYAGVVYGTQNAQMYLVDGDVSGNSSVSGSGGVLASERRAALVSVSGSVEYNVALSDGGVVYSNASAELRRVGGRVHGNQARLGGVLYSNGGVTGGIIALVEDVTGDISANVAQAFGGVVYGANAMINGVGGHVKGNRTVGNGGVVYATSDARIQNVARSVSANSADGSGGVAYAGVAFTLDRVGDVVYNEAGELGGVGIAVSHTASITNVSGSVSYNTAYGRLSVDDSVTYGGVLSSAAEAIIARVSGNISSNSAGYGGVVSARDAKISEIGGNIEGNDAKGDGGVVFASTSSLSQVAGSLIDNSARRGGVIFASYQGLISDVGGDVARNVAQDNGGVFAGETSRSTEFSLARVGGDVAHNVARNLGGVAYHESGTSAVSDVVGSVTANLASAGAVMYNRGANPSSSATLERIGGDVSFNGGGVLYAPYTTVRDVNGDLRGNSGQFISGVASGASYAVVERVGSIIGNSVEQGEGGAFSSASVLVSDVYGNITGNQASTYGGAFSGGSVSVRNVSGDVRGNTADYGGVLASTSSNGVVVLGGVEGSIELNRALYNGGVIFTIYQSVRVHSIQGDIAYNSAVYGGVVYQGLNGNSIVRVDDVQGQVAFNEASYFGGVVYASSGFVLNVAGGVCGNSAFLGGVVYANQAGHVSSVLSGAIADNYAQYYGGVVYAQEEANVDAGNGVVVGNIAGSDGDVVYSVIGLEQVEGAFIGPQPPTITVVQQPSDGVEGVPLPTQPILSIPGAIQGHSLAIAVAVVFPASNRTVEISRDSFEVTHGTQVRFADLAVPVSGEDLVLEFSVEAVECGSSEPSAISSVRSDPFDVGTCVTPNPVECAGDVETVTEPRECFAFVEIPLPQTGACSDVEITSSIAISRGEPIAGAQFPVGTTLVSFTADAGGSTDTCLTAVTVVDAEAPSITCPDTVVSAADPGKCGARLDLAPATAQDNCGAENVQISSNHPSTFFPVGVTVVVWTASDTAGLRSQCQQEVVIVDTEPPELLCPTDLTLPCDSPLSFGKPVASDNCPGVVLEQLTTPELSNTTATLASGDTIFAFEALDAAGLRSTCRWTVTTQSSWYIDADGDGVGASGTAAVVQCPKPGPNYVLDKNYDCDDTNPHLGLVLYQDNDGDTWGNINAVTCSAWSVGKSLRSVDALSIRPGDCDDTNPFVNPGTAEVCFNRIDDNCNGQVDENCPSDQSSYSIPTIPSSTIPASLPSR